MPRASSKIGIPQITTLSNEPRVQIQGLSVSFCVGERVHIVTGEMPQATSVAACGISPEVASEINVSWQGGALPASSTTDDWRRTGLRDRTREPPGVRK